MSKYVDSNAIGTKKEIYYNRILGLNKFIDERSNILKDVVNEILSFDNEFGTITIVDNGGLLDFNRGKKGNWSFVNENIEKSRILSVNIVDTDNLSDGDMGATLMGVYYEIQLM